MSKRLIVIARSEATNQSLFARSAMCEERKRWVPLAFAQDKQRAHPPYEICDAAAFTPSGVEGLEQFTETKCVWVGLE